LQELRNLNPREVACWRLPPDRLNFPLKQYFPGVGSPTLSNTSRASFYEPIRTGESLLRIVFSAGDPFLKRSGSNLHMRPTAL